MLVTVDLLTQPLLKKGILFVRWGMHSRHACYEYSPCSPNFFDCIYVITTFAFPFG